MTRRKGSTKNPSTLELERGLALAEALKQEMRAEIRYQGRTEAELAARLGFSRTFFPNLQLRGADGRSVSLRMEVFLAVAELLELPPEEMLRAARKRLGAPQAAAQELDAPPAEGRLGGARGAVEEAQPERLRQALEAVLAALEASLEGPETSVPSGAGEPPE